MKYKKALAASAIVLVIVSFAAVLPAFADIVEVRLYLPLVMVPESSPIDEIDNPGFEQGQTGWVFYSQYPGSTGVVTNLRAHSGQYSTRLGHNSLTKFYSYISQQVTVPSGRHTLTYWHYLDSEEDYCPLYTRYDYVSIQINGTEVAYYNLCDNGSMVNNQWVKQTVDLFAYQGQNVQLKIFYEADYQSGGTLPSDFYVDDFSFQ